MLLNLMCIAPILIANPNYNSPIRSPTYHVLHNTTDTHIPVPCGQCASCVHLRQIYLIQRVQMEAINNDLFFGTLTYNNDSLPIARYGDIEFAYPDFSDWQKTVKMIRKYHPDLVFKYLLVTEYGGSKKHRPHFHFILSVPKSDDFRAAKISKAYELFHLFLQYWRRNYGSTRNPIWKPLCTYVRTQSSYNYDLHWLDPFSSKDGLDGVAFYVTKYLLKYDDWIIKFKTKLYYNLSHDDYRDAWSKFRPRLLLSKGFGSPDDREVQHHIIDGINFALDNKQAYFPYFISKHNGSTYPLAPYYSKRFLDIKSQLVFISRRPDMILTQDDFDDFDKRQTLLSDIRSFLKSQVNLVDLDMIDVNSKISTAHDYSGHSFEAQEFADAWKDF